MELIIGANTVVPSNTLTLEISLNHQPINLLDFSAYLLDQNHKVRGDDDMVFYGQTQNFNRTVCLTEQAQFIQFTINLAHVDVNIQKIAICATMADQQLNFSKINRLNLTLKNQAHSIASAHIDGQHRTEAALILGEFYRYHQQWKFRLFAQGFNGGLKPLAEHFGVEIAEPEDLEINIPHIPPPPPLAEHGFLQTIKTFFNAPIKAREKKKSMQQFEEMLLEALSDGQLTTTEMTQLAQFCQQQGLQLQEALEQSKPHIDHFLRFTLAGIASEQTVTNTDRQLIDNLCDFLRPNAAMLREIQDRLSRIQTIEQIKQGHVQPIRPRGFVSNNTEIIWLHLTGLHIANIAKEHQRSWGEIFITSERVVFKSAEKPASIPINSIIGLESKHQRIYLSAKTKKNSCVFFTSQDADLLEAHLDHAINRFHRRLDLRHSASNNRRIPQQVRSLVWARCQGQCVECSSTQYLEYDHIIPFSKGGSNSEDNLQILCRACNLAKRDRI